MSKKLTIFLSVFAFSSGCSQIVQPSGDITPTIECILTYPADTQTLFLSWSGSVEETEAKLFDITSNEFIGLFEYQGNGKMILPSSVIPQHQYKIEVRIPDYAKTITAETQVPASYIASSTLYRKLPINSWSNTAFAEYIPTCYDMSVFGKETLWVFALCKNYDTDGYYLAERLFANDTNNSIDVFNRDGGEENVNYFMPALPCHSMYLRIPHPNSFSTELILKNIDGGYNNYGATSELTIWPDCEGDGYAPFFQSDEVVYHSGPSSIPNFDDASYVVLMTVSNEYDLYLKNTLLSKVVSDISGGKGIFGASISYYMPWACYAGPSVNTNNCR